MATIGWTQPLCEPCYVAWLLGSGRPPREPVRVKGEPGEPATTEPCLVCGTETRIYTRIDPALAALCPHPKRV